MEKIKYFLKNKIFLYVLLSLFCLLLACLSKEYDYDLYARLIVGENFVEAGIINFKDYLSYTPTHIWYDHEWGAGVIFYIFLKYFGALGFVILQTITLFFTTPLKNFERFKFTTPECLILYTSVL